MISRVDPPKCLFHAATEIEKDRYTLIEQSAHLVLLKLAFINTIQLYSWLIISLAITVYYVYMQLRYIIIMYNVTVK